MLLMGFSILLPLVASHSLSARYEEAEGARLVALLDQMEMHFLFFAASVPKIIENLFGIVLNPGVLARFGELDIANSWILLVNNIATIFVVFRLVLKHRLTRHAIRFDWMYLMAIIAIVMSVSLVIQPRYFYLVYVILCIEAARRNGSVDAAANPENVAEGLVHA